jgi:hypothetical protein
MWNATAAALENELHDEAAMPVSYRKSRIKSDVAKIMRSGGFRHEHVDAIAATKSVHWAYQEEVRSAVSLKGETPRNDYYFADVDIRGIVVGAASGISEVQIRTSLPAGKSIKVTYARPAFGSYKIVHRRDLSVKVVAGEGAATLLGTPSARRARRRR